MRALLCVVGIAILLPWGVCEGTTIDWTPASDMIPQLTTSVAAGDLDGDMDQDLSFIGGNYHYWNIGTPQEPVWELDLTQYSAVPSCHLRTGTLGDVDDDGDLDLVIGCADWYESLRLYLNTGSPASPAWEHDPAAFAEYPNNEWPMDPYLADMDADGDLDICIATCLGHLSYLVNLGTPASPDWVHTGLVEGIQIGPGCGSSAGLGDIDGDGDLDLVAITNDTPLQCWENTGTPQAFEFTENPDMVSSAPVSPEAVGHDVELFDIDADGDQDLLVITLADGNYLFLNDGFVVPVQHTSWGMIKALFR